MTKITYNAKKEGWTSSNAVLTVGHSEVGSIDKRDDGTNVLTLNGNEYIIRPRPGGPTEGIDLILDSNPVITAVMPADDLHTLNISVDDSKLQLKLVNLRKASFEVSNGGKVVGKISRNLLKRALVLEFEDPAHEALPPFCVALVKIIELAAAHHS